MISLTVDESMRLFGSSGIRGIVNEEFTPELALNIGLAIGDDFKDVCVGRDTRTSAPMIESALVSGLTCAGADVTLLGIIPTPTLAHYCENFGCGVMITASHNPPEYIGVKLWNSDGSAFNSKQQHNIERKIEEIKKVKRASWEDVGIISVDEGAIDFHVDKILKKCKADTNFKVVCDTGCGAGGVVLPYLLERMGCKVITLNSQLDGHFPGREPEPIQENLGELIELVKSSGADLGVAQDGDADRAVFVDEKGRYVDGDTILAIFALESEGDVVYTVDTSMAVDEVLSRENRKGYRTKVGDVYVAEKVKEVGASFGGESSGTWIFPELSYCPDGVYATAKLINTLHENNAKLSELVEEIPKYPRKREKIPCEREIMKKVMECIKTEISKLSDKIDYTDGVRIELEDGWALIRPSGTESYIRMTVEGNIREIGEVVRSVVVKCIRRCR